MAKLTNGTIYFDPTSDPKNAGWVIETDESGRPQYQLDASVDATNEQLIAESRAYADGDISIRRSHGGPRPNSGRPTGVRLPCGACKQLLTAVQWREHFTKCPKRARYERAQNV